MNFYHFNPTCDYAVNNGNVSWQPNRLLRKMETDLEMIPIYFANSSDSILLEKPPSKEFKDRIAKLGIKTPNFLNKNDLLKFSASNIEIDELLPWGWSPAEHYFLKHLKPLCSEKFRKSSVYNWKKEHRDLYSKKFAIQILSQLLAKSDSHYLITNDKVGMICTTKIEIENLLRKWEKLMIKAPWSSSGRGIQPISKKPVHEKVWEKIIGIIKDQGYVIVEPLLDKVFDFALQFKMEKGKVEFLGTSNFITDNKGQYQGNYLNCEHQNFSTEIIATTQFIIKNISPLLIEILEASDLAIHYEGNFGVDMLFFRDEQQNLKINPCLEINVRQNMGLLSLQLEKFIVPEKPGKFCIYYNPQKSFYDFAREMKKTYPLLISNIKIQTGFFPLTDFNEESMFGAYLLIE